MRNVGRAKYNWVSLQILHRTIKSIRAGQWREFKQKAYRRRIRRLVLALPNQSQTPDEYETRHDKGKPMAAPENKLLQHAEGISDDGKNMLHKVVAARNLLLEGGPWSSRGAGPEGGEMGVVSSRSADSCAGLAPWRSQKRKPTGSNSRRVSSASSI